MKPMKSPHERTRPTNLARMEHGQKMAEAVRMWMESHKDEFYQMFGIVRNLHENGCVGRARDLVAVECMRLHIELGDGDYRFAHSLWTGIERYMVLLDPSLDGAPIVMNESDIDCWGLYPVSWMEVQDAQ